MIDHVLIEISRNTQLGDCLIPKIILLSKLSTLNLLSQRYKYSQNGSSMHLDEDVFLCAIIDLFTENTFLRITILVDFFCMSIEIRLISNRIFKILITKTKSIWGRRCVRQKDCLLYNSGKAKNNFNLESTHQDTVNFGNSGNGYWRKYKKVKENNLMMKSLIKNLEKQYLSITNNKVINSLLSSL
jgi:hypothetical protein